MWNPSPPRVGRRKEGARAQAVDPLTQGGEGRGGFFILFPFLLLLQLWVWAGTLDGEREGGGTRNEPISSRREAASVVVGGQKTLLLGPEGKAEGWRRRRRREKRDPIRGPFCSKPPSSFLARGGGIRQWHAGNRTKNVAGAIDRKLDHAQYIVCFLYHTLVNLAFPWREERD